MLSVDEVAFILDFDSIVRNNQHCAIFALSFNIIVKHLTNDYKYCNIIMEVRNDKKGINTKTNRPGTPPV